MNINVAQERNGWRDSALSQRHRLWGFDCPATDIDFLLIEFHSGKVCAIVEYKHKNAKTPDITSASFRALIDLADGYRDAPIPCLIATYDSDLWTFAVTPLNEAARIHYAHTEGHALSEQQFVKSLYLLRKNQLTKSDSNVIAALNVSLGLKG